MLKIRLQINKFADSKILSCNLEFAIECKQKEINLFNSLICYEYLFLFIDFDLFIDIDLFNP